MMAERTGIEPARPLSPTIFKIAPSSIRTLSILSFVRSEWRDSHSHAEARLFENRVSAVPPHSVGSVRRWTRYAVPRTHYNGHCSHGPTGARLRKRESNPRRCYPYVVSSDAQSTTLPFLIIFVFVSATPQTTS